MTLRDDLVTKLEEENDELRERVRQLEGLLGMTFEAPLQFGLTAKESRVLGTLMNLPMATKQALMTALYRDRIDAEPGIKIVDVFVCKMRAKLEPFGIRVETLWGQGYFLKDETKAALAATLAEFAPSKVTTPPAGCPATLET